MALNLAFETVGSGAPLLVLHGLFGSSTNWRGVARQLADTHTVHSVDLRNHGASPWSDSMDYAEMADDVMQLMEECVDGEYQDFKSKSGAYVREHFFGRHPETRALVDDMLVVGGGIIGLEMATVYSTLGTRIDVVEMLDGLMQGADRDLVKVWEKANASRFDNVMLKTKTVGAKATPDGIEVSFEGEKASKAAQLYDLVLVAVGRSPNGQQIGADKAGVVVGDRGFIPVDNQMRTNVPHIFAIGDIVCQPMLAHKAVHEAHVAAEAADGQAAYFDARQIPSVAYTDPEVAWAGKTEEQCKAEGLKVGKEIGRAHV